MNNELEEMVRVVQEEIKLMTANQASSEMWGKESDDLKEKLSKPKLIMVAGNLGFGKSTITKVLSRLGHAIDIYEPLDNPILKLYYDDMASYSERLQNDLFNVRFNDIIINRIQNPTSTIISDRTTYEDPLIFCQVLKNSDLMNQESLDFCNFYFKEKLNQLESRYKKSLTPDLIINLKGSFETGWKRVKNRNRALEVREDAKKGTGLTQEFYQTLHNQYETFEEDLKQFYQGPVLTLPQDDLGVCDIHNSKGLLYAVRTLNKALSIINNQN